MLKSCKKCGRVHDKKEPCTVSYKQYVNKYNVADIVRDSEADKFRGSVAWQKKREQIRKRDLYLCRVCLSEGRYYNDVQVHHITPLIVDYDKRLDDDNLVCLCAYHHELAESGRIDAGRLRELSNTPPVI